ncbi:type II toxin-antitoxin system PemK/MazF family toxin [Halorhabdus amylolytica]|uniref:type II toxin-antitoxin system PemK/MazF family toxin n=1 Tax=Halorhabdus amylolytica TaxID=2559573 RepID=UPI0010AA7FAB|nr:type II toxin-antitoxin system PemK/MazF family toxin [Halorhabdus amylolytica]
MAYRHGDVVSIPDPHDRRPSRPAVIISDSDCPDHGTCYTVAAITGSERFGETRYAVEVETDEPVEGTLLKRSFVEPWTTERIAHDDIRDVHARFGAETMKRIAKAYAAMVLRG